MLPGALGLAERYGTLRHSWLPAPQVPFGVTQTKPPLYVLSKLTVMLVPVEEPVAPEGKLQV